jgi:transposase-like protein
MCTVPRPYPKEFRDDVVRVVRSRGADVTIAQIAEDFGISDGTITNWLKAADVEDGVKPGVTSDQAREIRELKRRNRLLEQEVEVLRRAAAYLSQASLPGKGSTRS